MIFRLGKAIDISLVFKKLIVWKQDFYITFLKKALNYSTKNPYEIVLYKFLSFTV